MYCPSTQSIRRKGRWERVRCKNERMGKKQGAARHTAPFSSPLSSKKSHNATEMSEGTKSTFLFSTTKGGTTVEEEEEEARGRRRQRPDLNSSCRCMLHNLLHPLCLDLIRTDHQCRLSQHQHHQTSYTKNAQHISVMLVISVKEEERRMRRKVP